jgi:hypothetical protein
MRALLPPPPGPAGGGAAGCAAAAAAGGYAADAGGAAALEAALDAVRANLRREQREIMDFNAVLMSRILRPLQTARYLVAAFPRHCDALAVANELAARERGGAAAAAGGSAA